MGYAPPYCIGTFSLLGKGSRTYRETAQGREQRVRTTGVKRGAVHTYTCVMICKRRAYQVLRSLPCIPSPIGRGGEEGGITVTQTSWTPIVTTQYSDIDGN